jgi:hypothetical protein
MSSESEVIETTVSKVAAELAKRGLDPDDRVTIMIESDELIPGRRASRARVIAAGLSDDRPTDQAGAKGSRAACWMRVVVDTNVLVSAALKQKSMPGMTALLVERRGGLLKSFATEGQLFEVVARPRLALLD